MSISNIFFRAGSLIATIAMFGLTGCGLPSFHGGLNIFEKVYGCPDCPGDLACKCNPDPFCFGYHSTNWKHLGPECNQTEHASESLDPAIAKLNKYDERVFREAINVPNSLLGAGFELPVDQHDVPSNITLQSYEQESILAEREGSYPEDLNLPEGAVIIDGGMPEGYAGPQPGCSSCGGGCDGGVCQMYRKQRHEFADRPGLNDGQGVFLIEKIFGCPDCPGELVCKCNPDPFCAGLHATNWRVMGNDCNASEASVGATPPDELDADSMNELGDDSPPQPPATGAEDHATPPDPRTIETPRPELPIREPADFPSRPDPQPLENEDIPDLFPQHQQPGKENKQNVVKFEDDTKTTLADPPKLQMTPAKVTVLRTGVSTPQRISAGVNFGPGLRAREVAPASHETEIVEE